MREIWFFCILAGYLAGCSTSPKASTSMTEMLEQEVGDLDESLASKIMSETYASHSKSRDHVEGEIKRKVWIWLRHFSVHDRDRFRRNLERGEIYRPLVQQMLVENDLPSELYYLAMIESGFVTHATSSAKAIGIWQFMRPTAATYGLGVSNTFDERRHPVAATQAAAHYLTFLHKKFSSWYLAIAAYNAGEGRIEKAIRRGRTRDFWKLADRGLLPRETMDYIPKFLAAATIGANLDKFGFENLRPRAPVWPQVVPITLNPGMRLSRIAKSVDLTEEELVRLNPQLKSPGAKITRRMRIWLPRDAVMSGS